jgi:imidazolonepropionase-like amidohydrolase
VPGATAIVEVRGDERMACPHRVISANRARPVVDRRAVDHQAGCMFALRAARLFDGTSATIVEQPVVVVDGGRIVEVRTDAPDVEVVDLGDVTLLPGLIDAHVHLAFDASADPVARLASAGDDEVLDGMRAAARTALRAGITTVRDLGDRGYLGVRLRDEFAADPAAGPRVLAAGPPITTTRGHCWYLGGEADGVDGVRAAVREHAARGVDVIKVMASGGELTPGTASHRAQYDLAELRAAVDEAHRLGLPATAHAHAGDAVSNVVAAGFDSVEHCSFMTEEGVEAPPDIIASIARSGIVVSGTFGVRPGTAPPPRIAARLGAFAEVFARLTEAGVPIVCSSDAGIGPPKPHDVLPHAIAMLVNLAGWAPVDALRATTSLPAKLCRVGDRVGRLAAGFDADILAVAGNPLVDIAALLDVRAVFRFGHRVR